MHALAQYFSSSSGYVLPRRTLSFGTAVVALAVIAIIGGFQPAAADYCYNIPEGQFGWVCHPDRPNCPTPPAPYCDYVYYYHSPTLGCLVQDAACCNCYS